MWDVSLVDAVRCVQEKCCWATAIALAGALAALRAVARDHVRRRTQPRRTHRFPVRFTIHTSRAA